VTQLLADTSVLIKWFHSERETELREARAVRSAHLAGDVEVHIIDLATYELGNVLVRALRWTAADVADQLDDLYTIVGSPLALSRDAIRLAARLASDHRLTFHDASWAAAASDLGVSLVSADRELLDAGLAESVTDVVARLRLAM
jgi:predicted nucleic acid-binding protein